MAAGVTEVIVEKEQDQSKKGKGKKDGSSDKKELTSESSKKDKHSSKWWNTDPLICSDVEKRVTKERQNCCSASDCFYNQILNNYFYRMEKKQRETVTNDRSSVSSNQVEQKFNEVIQVGRYTFFCKNWSKCKFVLLLVPRHMIK